MIYHLLSNTRFPNRRTRILIVKARQQRRVCTRKREAKKRYDIMTKDLLLFNDLNYLLRTSHKYLTPWKIRKAQIYAKKALQVWRILKFSANPKCHGYEYHACGLLEFQWGLVDFCEDWVKQLRRLGLKITEKQRRSGIETGSRNFILIGGS